MVDPRVAAEKHRVGTPYMTRRLKCRIDPEGVDAPLNQQDAVVIAVLCAVLQPILIAVQWPSLPVPVLACRALFLQIRRNRLLPQVGYETARSLLSSAAAGLPTS